MSSLAREPKKSACSILGVVWSRTDNHPEVVRKCLECHFAPYRNRPLHIDRLIKRIAPCLVQEANQGKVTPRGRRLAHAVGCSLTLFLDQRNICEALRCAMASETTSPPR